MKVLAFDQATSTTGWAIGTENSNPRANDRESRYHYGVIKAPKREEFGERLAYIWREITILVEGHQPELIAYEEPFFPIQGQGGAKQKQHFRPASGFLPAEVSQDQGSEHGEKSRFNPETLKQLQMVKGIIITFAALRGIPVAGCTPSQWRKTVLGYGRKPNNESDDYMKRAVKQHFQRLGFDVAGPHDVTDALGVLYHTLHGPEAAARKQGDLLSMARSTL